MVPRSFFDIAASGMPARSQGLDQEDSSQKGIFSCKMPVEVPRLKLSSNQHIHTMVRCLVENPPTPIERARRTGPAVSSPPRIPVHALTFVISSDVIHREPDHIGREGRLWKYPDRIWALTRPRKNEAVSASHHTHSSGRHYEPALGPAASAKGDSQAAFRMP